MFVLSKGHACSTKSSQTLAFSIHSNLHFSAKSQTITLLVGEKEVPLVIHKKVLCEASPFFESACKPEWMKDDEPTIKLPEDDPELVDIMVYCKCSRKQFLFSQCSEAVTNSFLPRSGMYRNVLCFPASSFNAVSVGVSNSIDTPPGLLAKLFILAEKYQITPLQNDIIDAILIWLDDFDIHHRIPAKVIQYIWDNTVSEDCLLRQFLVDYVCAEYTFWDLKTARYDLEGDFWFRLSREMALVLDVMRDDGGEMMALDDLRADFCPRWHKHGPGEGRNCEIPKRYVLDAQEEGER